MNVNFNPNLEVKQNKKIGFRTFIKPQKADEFESQTKKEKKDFKTKAKEFFAKFKTGIFVVTSSLMTGLTVFAATSKKTKSLEKENNDLQAQNHSLRGEKEVLQTEKDALNERKAQLEEQVTKLQNIMSEVGLSENTRDDIQKKIEEIDERELSYSPTENIMEGRKRPQTYKNHGERVSFPPKQERTSLRSDAKKLEYPTFKEGEPYSFEFPMSNEVKIVHDSTAIEPKGRTATTISGSYADSLAWSNAKIARDLMQNFYDGHGQTLDGVKISATPSENGKYKVRIEGKSTFSADKAVLLGESSKKNDNKAAGNYGEGLKMVVLKLLREKGADQVNIASNNWNVNWSFQDSSFGKKVLSYQIDEMNKIDGNYIEFETNDTELIKEITKTYDRFYHYNNPAFKCPNFENNILGIQLTDNNQDGKFFIAGQAFEVDGIFNGLEGMNIYIKEKPPLKYKNKLIFDPSRDRTSLSSDNLKALGNWVVAKNNMPKDDVVKLIQSLEEYWDVETQATKEKYEDNKAVAFIEGLFQGAGQRCDINIEFDKKNLADYYSVSSGIKNFYMNSGYRICNKFFQFLGMECIYDVAVANKNHKILEPTQAEKNKILILQEAIQLLSPVLNENGMFTEEELQSPIFIFDRFSEPDVYKDVIGEAITEGGKTLGFWLDKTALNDESFSTMLSTSLHELTHKFGGDSSEEFSYKLTDVLERVFKAINKNPKLAIKLKVLEEAWKAQKN